MFLLILTLLLIAAIAGSIHALRHDGYSRLPDHDDRYYVGGRKLW